jgi:hypothetical protein
MGGFKATDPNYTRFGIATHNGTSQAAPLVAGVILLLQECYLDLTRNLHPKNPLPSVDLLVEHIRKGSEPFKDEKNADNVKNSGATFLLLNASNAHASLMKEYYSDLARIHADVGDKKPHARKLLDLHIGE